MNIERIEELISIIENLQAKRYFHCEYLLVSNEGNVRTTGNVYYYVGSLTPINSEIIQNIKDYILRSLQQDNVYTLQFSAKNIVLGAFIELEDNRSEIKKVISREQLVEIIADLSEIELSACNYYVSKLIEVADKVWRTQMPIRKQIFEKEFLPTVALLPIKIRQELSNIIFDTISGE